MNTMTLCFNEIVNSGEIPKNWKNSRTVMIPKVNKPKIN